MIKSTRKGLGIIRSWKPDLIHAHFTVPARAATYFLAKLTGIPYVLTVHGGDVPGAAPEKTAGWFCLVYPFSKLIWKNAVRVIAVSEYVKELAEKKYAVPIQVIGNGINLKQFTPQENRISCSSAYSFCWKALAGKESSCHCSQSFYPSGNT